jgi:hypothetical protein
MFRDPESDPLAFIGWGILSSFVASADGAFKPSPFSLVACLGCIPFPRL